MNFGDFTFPEKGYMKENNLIEWVQNILIPYVIQVRTEINQEDYPVILILDNLEQHLTRKVHQELIKIEPCFLVQFPPHSSHLTQPCDQCIFILAKGRYNSIPYPTAQFKFTSKLLRIKKAIHETLSEENIISSWKHCGFIFIFAMEFVTKLNFLKNFKKH